jgi:glycosyltransferase involved in cell wall biosynthesis
MNSYKDKKIAIFHHFLLSHCKGGGEKLMLQIMQKYNADFWCGSIDLKDWDYNTTPDSFTEYLKENPVKYLAQESSIKGWNYIKRQLSFIFSNKINELALYDIVIFSFGNIAFVPQRLKKLNPNIKIVGYIHTPPRIFTDQKENTLKKLNFLTKPLFNIFATFVLWNYKRALDKCDYLIANSLNIKERLIKYCDITVDKVIFPFAETEKFYNKPSQDFFLSHARLEPLKRIDLIVKTFEQLPNERLIITSGGPLKDWIVNYIKDNNITNIQFKGRVDDKERDELMATCRAGIYVPIDEDAGITQLEFMACGKPVIGVNDGGLKESIIDGKTGFLMSKDPTVEEFKKTIEKVLIQDLEKMKNDCINQSKNFDKNTFFNEFDEVLKKYVD